MSKEPLSWHRECLINQQRTLNEEQARMDRQAKHLAQRWKEYLYYMAQIQRAEKEGRDGFDSERFTVKGMERP